ncbi:MAG TPA: alpha/beta fold hydrolase [Thermoanaerobaculia bacterium]|nr:alpha/beta fold hydrolase [Thermoanaerobaculia bacterium]
MKTCRLALLLVLASFTTAAFAAEGEQGQTLNLKGLTLWYEVRGGGSATPLLVVNGGPGFDHTYLHISDAWDALAKTRKVVFYDQRGNGRSSPLAAGQSCTLADQIADLEALRSHLGFDKIALLGHSWGGYLVMAYAARHPERIAHLIIADSAAPKWSDTLFLFKEIFPEGSARQEALAFAEELGDKEATGAYLREYFAMLFYSPDKRDEFLSRAGSFAYRKEINQALNNDVGRFDLNPELAKFRFPALVITGRYDINVAPSVAWKIHKAIPGSMFIVFEKSGHLPFFEERDAFVKVIEEFLAKP